MEITKIYQDTANESVFYVEVDLAKEEKAKLKYEQTHSSSELWPTCIEHKLWFNPRQDKFWVTQVVDELEAMKRVMEYVDGASKT